MEAERIGGMRMDDDDAIGGTVAFGMGINKPDGLLSTTV